MNQSLSILLPVYNAQQTLAQTVAAVIEVAAELTGQFELAIIDDGSTDHTEEVACDLARWFPQVSVVRHHRRRGSDAAMETGMSTTRNEIVIVVPQGAPLQASEMRRLWQIGAGYNIAPAGAASLSAGAESSTVVARLLKWGRHLKQVEAERGEGLRMFRRDRYEKRRPPHRFQPRRVDRETELSTAAPNFLTRLRDFALGE